MVFFLESVVLAALFYLIGSVELRGLNETRAAYSHKKLFAAILALLLFTILAVSATPDLLPLICILTPLLLVIAILDLETGLMSDVLSLVLGAAGVAYGLIRAPEMADYLPTLATGIALGALGAFFAGPYSKWRGRDMLGWGDVKFFAAAGLWLAPTQLPLFLAIAGLAGVVNALVYRARTGRAESPFAPPLCLALWLCVIYGLNLETLAL